MKLSDIKEPITCSVKELAERLSMDVDSVARLARQGILRKAKRGEYMLIESMEAYVIYQRQSPTAKRSSNGEQGEPEDSTEADFERHRARLYKARADRAERDNAIAAGDLHEAKTVAEYLGPMIANFRAKALAMPNDLAPLIPIECRAEVREQVDDCVRNMLTELSEYDPAKIAEAAQPPAVEDDEEEDEEEEPEQ